ncbi:MAG: phosphoribosylformylglycinamidine synthase subunit PurS [Thermoplasmata archaeon]|nr:phosphoribosylformylglycinamidine synthase subunit PurS [Thermoplasmata archaeon]
MILAEVRIKLKKGVADPEGANTRKALELLGFTEVLEVKTSKCFSIQLDTDDMDHASGLVENMCKSLLANPVIQSYEVDLTREG